MDTSQIGKVAKRIDEDDRNLITVINKLGRKQNMYVVNKSGLYSVILHSDKEETKPFHKWIKAKILPIYKLVI